MRGRKVLLRLDINCPIKDGKIHDASRIEAHSSMVKELAEKGARVIALAHQGRAGDKDFSGLAAHVPFLERFSRTKVGFVDDVIGPEARRRIAGLRDGEVLLLENIRFLAEESLEKAPAEHAKSIFVRTLAGLVDAYVNDAFSVSHRSHASIVGFPVLMPSYAGITMKKEVDGLEKICSSENLCLVLGGSKPEDAIDVLKALAPKAEKILVGGVVGELFLFANGLGLGEKGELLKSKFGDNIDEIRDVYRKYEERFVLPVDLAVEHGGERKEVLVEEVDGLPLDIGSRTCELFHEAIHSSDMVLMKGPMGAYENSLFAQGSKGIMESIESASRKGAFSVVCGGHTYSLAKLFGLRPSHVSLSGGAFIRYLAGEKLPGIETLRGNFNSP